MKNKLSNYNSSELINFNKKKDEKLILKGLKDKTQKNIDSKFFYDERGSNLFHEITKLDEYYLTKSELSIKKSLNFKDFFDNKTLLYNLFISLAIARGCSKSDPLSSKRSASLGSSLFLEINQNFL